MDIKVKESGMPGLAEAKEIQSLVRKAGIQDIEFFFDPEIRMWAVCQVFKNKGNFILPRTYMEGGVKPLILWWCKDDQSRFRIPNHQDFQDILAIVKNAPAVWAKGGEARADKFDEQDRKRDEAHKAKLKERLAPHTKALKKAVREELG